MERELIGWFEALMDRCEREIAPATAELWGQVLAAPMEIRGYGPVKHAAVIRTKDRIEELTARLPTASR